eukprot:scaffold8353_cov138-Cylindrotheca_fusiformis.AAC.45
MSFCQSTCGILNRCTAQCGSKSTPAFRKGQGLLKLRPALFSSGCHQGKPSTKSRPRLKTSSTDLNAVWYSSSRPRASTLDMGRYGLKRLNYKTLDPPVWTVPPQPPLKTTSDRIVFPLTVFGVASFIVWAYLNPEDEDMTDYWKRVETGEILYEDDDGDDDFDEE